MTARGVEAGVEEQAAPTSPSMPLLRTFGGVEGDVSLTPQHRNLINDADWTIVTRIYTKTVTATQWTGDNADELLELMGSDHFDPHGVGENDDDPAALASFRDGHHGGSWRPLFTGDWVLRDDAGDWHTCPNYRFTATYKPGQP